MKKLNIQITKAQIVSFRVELKDNQPQVSATIALLTDGNKPISSYSISTDTWNEQDKFALPVSIIKPIMDILKDIEPIVVKHCMGEHLQLTN